MRKIAAVLLIVVATSSYAEKSKASRKVKEFEPVTVTASSVAGSYGGPSESYGIVLELSADGTLRGNYVEMGRVAVLNAIAVKGSDFTARASFDDGSSRTITGSFAKRVLNGHESFGVRMHRVPVEDLGAIDTFFERL